jgi:hypothetical protein
LPFYGFSVPYIAQARREEDKKSSQDKNIADYMNQTEIRVLCGASKDAPEMPGIVRVYINPWVVA